MSNNSITLIFALHLINRNRFIVLKRLLIFSDCTPLRSPVDGYLYPNDTYQHETNVTVYCKENYTLFGAENLTCGFGNWSADVGQCFKGNTKKYIMLTVLSYLSWEKEWNLKVVS